ncbi:hypothetical protein [Flavobacterium fluviatile]|uniref:hypothetical protein n=1 Tax=Flavobacterium fluviatile TaxID=1862387 RepID=UPI0013D63A93|nr:hypothetical protein [Flavobacterium fluviatile]
MSGFKLKLPDAVTDTNMPILYPDPIMSKGSLFLFDPSNSVGGSPTILTNGGTVPNLAWKSAAEIIGSGNALTLAAKISTSGITSSTGILEMTNKKGVHFIYSKINGTSNTQWNCIFPDGIKTHLLNSWTTKKLYVSVWGQVTRIGDTNTSAFILIGNSSTFPSNYKTYFSRDSTLPNTNLGRRELPSIPNTVGKYFRNIAQAGSTGTTPTNLASTIAQIKLGAGNAFGFFEANKCDSRIIYRVYVEDLDISGRTYSEVDALDKALYDEAFGTGGKYYNDTFTDPATLP